MACPHDRATTDGFTQRCRDLIRTRSYEDILACTVYAPPLLFMVGPATIVAGAPVVTCALNAVLGCALGGMLHRVGHRLLTGMPNQPHLISLTRSVRLPVKLTLTQFLWMLEIIVAAGLFSGILGKRWIFAGTGEPFIGLGYFGAALALYFLPVYLGKLWMERHYPAMPLAGPTVDVVNRSLPGLRSLVRHITSILS